MASDYKQKPNPSKRLTMKIVISIFIGGLTYLITERLLKDNEPMALMTSVFMAGVIFVAQFLYEMESRMAKFGTSMDSHLDNVELKLNTNLKDLGHGAHLAQLLGRSPLPVDKVDGLVQDAIEVTASHPRLSAAMVISEVQRFATILRELRYHDTASYPGEDRDWLLSLAENANLSIKAISLATVDAGGHNFVDGGLWRSDLGIRYLDLQEEALTERKVKIQRIFVSDLPDDSTAYLLSEIFNPQRELGIEVRTLHPESIRGTAASKLHDFIVFDDELVYETTAAVVNNPKDTPKTLTTKISVDKDTVDDKSRFFDLLWSQAQEPDTVRGRRD